jgi:hypothetical protein
MLLASVYVIRVEAALAAVAGILISAVLLSVFHARSAIPVPAEEK